MSFLTELRVFVWFEYAGRQPIKAERLHVEAARFDSAQRRPVCTEIDEPSQRR